MALGVALAAVTAWCDIEPARAEDLATTDPPTTKPTTTDSATPHDVFEQLIDPGPPLTVLERHTLLSAMRGCWEVGALSAEAAQSVVAVSFELDPDGHLVGEVREVSVEAPTPEGGQEAGEAARAAVIACAGEGFDLPREKAL